MYSNLNGQNIGDGIWRDAVKNTLAGARKQYVLEFLWDVSKAFDSVDHQKLEAAARDRGYPWLLLKISLLSYRWTRVLVVEQVCSDDIFPTGGVGPGSTYAIFELAGYLGDDLEAVLGTCGPEVSLNIHVDDVATRAVHDDR